MYTLVDKMYEYKTDLVSIVEDTEQKRFCPKTDRRHQLKVMKIPLTAGWQMVKWTRWNIGNGSSRYCHRYRESERPQICPQMEREIN